jgi:pyruvate kinase
MTAGDLNLLSTLRRLEDEIAADAVQRLARWQGVIEQSSFATSASNLAHYLAFRHHDLRDLQRELMRHGLSSLGRLESRVMINLGTVKIALEALVGGKAPPASWPPASNVFFTGEALLRQNTCALLGRSPADGVGHILVTLSAEAAHDPSYMLDIVRRGANAMRINCAHDSVDEWTAMIANVRKASDATGRRIAVLMDLGGPKFRIGQVKRLAGERLRAGDRFRLVDDATAFNNDTMIDAVCMPGHVLGHLSPQTEVSLDDGKLGGVVETCTAGSAIVRVLRTQLKGFKLKPERGVTFPQAELHLDPLTSKDLVDLDFVAHNADIVGFSFVQTAEDVSRLQEELARRRSDWQRLGVVAKIETAQAVKNLPDIIVRAAGRQPFGVMIARGDLAVAIGFERLAEMQEEILWLCEAAHVPVIWATQVLEEMVKSGLPTRGEMTDAAMGTRAECVMLNKGPNVGEAVTALRGLLHRMTEHQLKKTARLRALRSW